MTKPTRPPVVETPESIGGGDAFAIGGRPDEPQIMLSISGDGGMTWLSLPSRSLGPVGAYRQRVRWHRLGSNYNMVIRFAVSDPVPLAVLDLQIEAMGSAP